MGQIAAAQAGCYWWAGRGPRAISRVALDEGQAVEKTRRLRRQQPKGKEVKGLRVKN